MANKQTHSKEASGNHPLVRLSRGEKEELCEQWQKSGLTKTEFCRRYSLPMANFFKWCQSYLAPIGDERVEPVEEPAHAWVEVESMVSAAEEVGQISVELSLPGSTLLRLKLSEARLLNLVKGLQEWN